MIKSLFVLTVIAVLAACAPGQAPEESGTPPPGQEADAQPAGRSTPEAEAVSQLNELCPENWCLGDYEYEFEGLACTATSCRLSFTARRDGESLSDSVEIDYDVALIDEFGDLEPGYFERVTDALDEWEIGQTEGD